MIGRVIEGLFTPWARDRNYPIMSVEIDGNLLPPSLVNKLNIFMVNVLRFGNADAGATDLLIEEFDEDAVATKAAVDCAPADCAGCETACASRVS